MLYETLECCGHKISTGNHTWIYLDSFQTKSGQPFFKKKFTDGREIKKEIILAGLCPNCKHRILMFLWYDKKNDSLHNWTESKMLKGAKADEVFLRRSCYWDMISIPDPFKNDEKIKHSKKIPWKYGKALDGEHYIERYIDETADASKKFFSQMKISS